MEDKPGQAVIRCRCLESSDVWTVREDALGSALVGKQRGCDTRIDGRTSGKQAHRRGSSAISGERRKTGVNPKGAGANDITIGVRVPDRELIGKPACASQKVAARGGGPSCGHSKVEIRGPLVR